jgi:putative iron-dependent peroxidase
MVEHLASGGAGTAILERLPHNMFVGNPPGTGDRILDVSIAVTGGLFFVRAPDLLEDAAG